MLEQDKKCYVDKMCNLSREQWNKHVEKTKTVYVGNLSFYTTEEQVHELFGRVGSVDNVIMGLNRETKRPCGFAFVEYATHEQAMAAYNIIKGSKLDDQVLYVDLDAGFQDTRQFGRGQSGQQWRDDLRPKSDYNPHRGGSGGGFLLQTNDSRKRMYFTGKRNMEREEWDERKKKAPRTDMMMPFQRGHM